LKKILLGIFVSMLMITSVLPITTMAEKEESLFKIQNGVISTTISVENYEIKRAEQVDKISVVDYGHRLIPGKPDLPSRIYSIAIPPGAELVDVNYEISESILLSGSYNIAPVQMPSPLVIEENPEVYQQELNKYNENYNEVYGSSNPYPAEPVEFVQTGGYRKYNLVDVRVMPFTYYPQTGQLVYYPEINIDVSYTFPEGFDYDQIMVDDVSRAEQFAEEFIFNYNQAKVWYPKGSSSRQVYDYVIITTATLEPYIQELVEWEEAKGREVYVATIGWIGTNYDGYDAQEEMRNFLRDKYTSDQWGIMDVCLIGSYDDVPMRRCEQNTGYGQPETDFYYAELSESDSNSWDSDGDQKYGENTDNIDMYAEINVGRIPWSDSSIVEHICQKSIAYEENDDETFKKNILLIGTFFWPDTDNAVLMELKTDPDEHPWMADWTRTTMYEEEQSDYECDYDVSYNMVEEVWSSGTYAFVNWAGHGSPTACYEYYPSQAFVDTDTCDSLDDDYPAIIFAAACSNSDTDHTNIGQKMLEQGGVGFLGATKVAYGYHGWTDPYSGAAAASLDYFFTTKTTSTEYTQGGAHQWSLAEMYTHDLWYYPKYETFEWGALWGNPDLTMGEVEISEPPSTPEKPSGPNNGAPLTEYTFTTTSTDPEGGQIYYMWNWGDGNETDWIGPFDSGHTADASHSWEIIGDYEMSVMAKDENGAKSEWSEILVFPVIENTPPSNPILDGPPTAKKGSPYTLKITSTDPHGHDVYYDIFWGYAGTGWEGPYPSGETIEFVHTYETTGTFTIRVKAKDIFDAKSDVSTLPITVSKEKTVNNPILLQLLERILGHFPLLQRILII
jgi:hypothetical protein